MSTQTIPATSRIQKSRRPLPEDSGYIRLAAQGHTKSRPSECLPIISRPKRAKNIASRRRVLHVALQPLFSKPSSTSIY